MRRCVNLEPWRNPSLIADRLPWIKSFLMPDSFRPCVRRPVMFAGCWIAVMSHVPPWNWPGIVTTLPRPGTGALRRRTARETTRSYDLRQIFVKALGRNGKGRAEFLGKNRDFKFFDHPAKFVHALPGPGGFWRIGGEIF